MRYRIIFEDGLMQLLDSDGNGHDAHPITPGSETINQAKLKIDEWKAAYPSVDATRAKRELGRYVNQL